MNTQGKRHNRYKVQFIPYKKNNLKKLKQTSSG